MLSRRELITAGMAGSLAPSAGVESTIAAAQPAEVEALRDIARTIQEVDRSVGQAWMSNAVLFGLGAKVRAQMEIFFRSNQKFPDFIDVGLSVFLDVYDWHIKNRQPLVVTRGPDARYWMQFMFTTLILRGEHDPTYIGIPYDKA